MLALVLVHCSLATGPATTRPDAAPEPPAALMAPATWLAETTTGEVTASPPPLVDGQPLRHYRAWMIVDFAVAGGAVLIGAKATSSGGLAWNPVDTRNKAWGYHGFAAANFIAAAVLTWRGFVNRSVYEELKPLDDAYRRTTRRTPDTAPQPPAATAPATDDTAQGGRVRGVVTDARTGAPLAATIHVPALDRDLKALENGRFRLAAEPSTYELVVSHPGFETLHKTVVLEAGETVDLELQLTPSAHK